MLCDCRPCDINMDFPFIQFMECTPPLDELNRALCCICLQWSTSDDIWLKAKSGLFNSDMGTQNIGDWYWMGVKSGMQGAFILFAQAQQYRLSFRTFSGRFTGFRSAAFTAVVLIIMRRWRQPLVKTKQSSDYIGTECHFNVWRLVLR